MAKGRQEREQKLELDKGGGVKGIGRKGGWGIYNTNQRSHGRTKSVGLPDHWVQIVDTTIPYMA